MVEEKSDIYNICFVNDLINYDEILFRLNDLSQNYENKLFYNYLSICINKLYKKYMKNEEIEPYIYLQIFVYLYFLMKTFLHIYNNKVENKITMDEFLDNLDLSEDMINDLKSSEEDISLLKFLNKNMKSFMYKKIPNMLKSERFKEGYSSIFEEDIDINEGIIYFIAELLKSRNEKKIKINSYKILKVIDLDIEQDSQYFRTQKNKNYIFSFTKPARSRSKLMKKPVRKSRSRSKLMKKPVRKSRSRSKLMKKPVRK